MLPYSKKPLYRNVPARPRPLPLRKTRCFKTANHYFRLHPVLMCFLCRFFARSLVAPPGRSICSKTSSSTCRNNRWRSAPLTHGFLSALPPCIKNSSLASSSHLAAPHPHPNPCSNHAMQIRTINANLHHVCLCRSLSYYQPSSDDPANSTCYSLSVVHVLTCARAHIHPRKAGMGMRCMQERASGSCRQPAHLSICLSAQLSHPL